MLIRQTVMYLPAQLIGPGFQFIVAVAWTHWLAPDAYGVLAYVLALQELASVSCLLWWSQFMLRYIRNFSGASERQRYQRVENVVIAGSAFCQTAMTIGGLALFHAELSPELVGATVLYIVARTTVMHIAERARAEERIGLYTASQLAGPIAGFLIGLTLVKLVAASPASAIEGLAVANVCVLAALWFWMGFGFSAAIPDRDIMRRALAFGAPLALSGAIAWTSPNGIRVVVDHAQGAAAVGLISVGWGLGQRFASVMAMTVTAAAFPLAVGHLLAGRKSEALEQISLNAAILFGLMAPATAGLLIVAPDLVRFAVAPAFRDVTLAILPIAALSGAIRNFRMHFADQVFLLFERTGTSVVVSLLEATTTLGLCWLGISWGGLVGAALGCLAGSIISSAFCFALGVLRYELPIPKLHMARVLAASLVMAGALRLVPWGAVVSPILLRMAAEAFFGVIIYTAVLAALYPGAARQGARRLRAAFAPLAGRA